MFFELCFGDLNLEGFIGKNKNLYWSAETVLNILECKPNYHFRRNLVQTLLDVAPKKLLERVKITSHPMKVMSHVRMILLLETSKKDSAQLMLDYFNRRSFPVLIIERQTTVLHVCRQDMPNTRNFYDWLKQFKRSSLLDVSEEPNDEILGSPAYAPPPLEQPVNLSYSPHSPAYAPPPLEPQVNFGYSPQSPAYAPPPLEPQVNFGYSPQSPAYAPPPLEPPVNLSYSPQSPAYAPPPLQQPVNFRYSPQSSSYAPPPPEPQVNFGYSPQSPAYAPYPPEQPYAYSLYSPASSWLTSDEEQLNTLAKEPADFSDDDESITVESTKAPVGPFTMCFDTFPPNKIRIFYESSTYECVRK